MELLLDQDIPVPDLHSAYGNMTNIRLAIYQTMKMVENLNDDEEILEIRDKLIQMGLHLRIIQEKLYDRYLGVQ